VQYVKIEDQILGSKLLARVPVTPQERNRQVESAPQLRCGGYIIDFGLVGYDVAEKMGLILGIRELGHQVKENSLRGSAWPHVRKRLDLRNQPPTPASE
jgi:hypothetical protein